MISRLGADVNICNADVVRLLLRTYVPPITQVGSYGDCRYPLEDYQEAFRTLMGRSAVGKVSDVQ